MKTPAQSAVTTSAAPLLVLESKIPPPWLSWTVWIIAASFYLAAFYLRVSPAVMTSELMRDFGIGAVALGQLSAFYYYAYVVLQIPTGVLVDSWGARRLLVLGAILAAAGVFLFGSTSNFIVACIGRALVGGATAVAWVITLKLATHWFPPRLFATLSGLGLMIGNIGALMAQIPLRLLVEHVGWRATVMGSGSVVLVLGVLAALVVKNDPSERGFITYAPLALQARDRFKFLDVLRGFRRIFGYRNTWLIFLAQGGIVGALLSFTGLWGVPFLKVRFGVESTRAAGVCSVMIVCWALASPICGNLSDRIGRRKPLYLGGTVIAAVGWIVMFYVTALSLLAFTVVAAITSIASGSVVLGFAYTKESVPVQFLGTISGAINMGNMIGPMLLQPGIGWVLDRTWSGQTASGARIYAVGGFEQAFVLVVAWIVISCMLISFTKETRCRQTA
jgi:sugar phosphate permease